MPLARARAAGKVLHLIIRTVIHPFKSSAVRKIQSNVSVDESADRLDGSTSERRILQPIVISGKSLGESQKATQATLGTAPSVQPAGEMIIMSASCEDWVGPALLTLSSCPEIKRPPSHQQISRTIGRLTTALASAYNENQVALANLNLDFTLLRVQAPLQFEGIGSMISSKRKENAESGLSHRTARKLGALFDGVLPDIPELIEAYGIRASEIARSERFKQKTKRQIRSSQTRLALIRRVYGRP
ncbi:MAG: hypothetical protein L6R36_004179 [Xanthoria steineri]|nr:MAG: hypothetical protein L6R36_004179 [Xanthoria steineri]